MQNRSKMRYGSDKSESLYNRNQSSTSPTSSSYQSSYNYQPPYVSGGTYAQQQTQIMEDTMRTHYETEATAGGVLSQMQTQRQQLNGANNNVWEMRQNAEKAKEDITVMVKRARQKKRKLQIIAIGLALIDFFLLVRLLQCGGSFFCRIRKSSNSNNDDNYNGNNNNDDNNNNYNNGNNNYYENNNNNYNGYYENNNNN